MSLEADPRGGFTPQTTITDTSVQRKLTIALSSIIFFSVLNGTMFNVSIPDIGREFNLLPSQVSWVVSGYIILFALGTVIYGKLADNLPVKNLITFGLILFSTGSLIGFLARWYPMLIAGRMVQASGAGAIPALAMLVTTRYFPADIRGRSLGIIASTVASGAAVGPLIGGFITGTFHWRYLFLISLLALFAIPHLRGLLPDEEKHAVRFDKSGAVLLSFTVAALLLSVTLGALPAFGAACVLGTWFILHIRRADAPFVPPALFRNRKYRIAVIATFFTVGTVFGMMFLVPLMLRALNNAGAREIGLVMFPGALSAAILGVAAGKLSDKRGSVPVVRIGQALLIAGFFLLSVLAGNAPWIVALNLIICYAGFSFLQSSLAHTVSATLPREQMGIGMGIYNLVLFMSGGFSAALIGKLLDLTGGRASANAVSDLPAASSYSVIFLLLALVVLAASALFHTAFRAKDRK
ncbi:MAG: MFS transporter [Nitrospirota bacterium]|nr:MFS transporter [Nitrospirota bacterium]